MLTKLSVLLVLYYIEDRLTVSHPKKSGKGDETKLALVVQ